MKKTLSRKSRVRPPLRQALKYTLAVAQAGVETHSLATAGNNTTFVVHHNTHIPYMPSELRHTNYGSKTQLIHPQVNF
jgi:hypothetical protein